MRYLPHTESEIKEMLAVIGKESIASLFDSIPQELQLGKPLAIPSSLPELQLRRELRELSRENAHGDRWHYFIGGGRYRHYTPSAVQTLISRSEFSTSYTPYQPEISQGTLQALFEYQTMVAELTGMEIANASNYDGASSAAEAVVMALRLTRKKKVLLAKTLHPAYREVIRTYLQFTDVTFEEIAYDSSTGSLDRNAFQKALDDQTACLVVGYPNFFGVIEDFSDLTTDLSSKKAHLITATPEPCSLAIAKTPGEMGATIAVGEGQSFGNSISYGGPSLGLFATRKEFARQVPGRLVGETIDAEGKRGYVLTLATREQHIRREKATSNICTNVSLCALAATITLSLLGPAGLQRIAGLSHARASRLREQLIQIPGIELSHSGTTFNEFVIKLPDNTDKILQQLESENIFGGINPQRWYPELENHLLVCATEMNQDYEIDEYAGKLGKILAG